MTLREIIDNGLLLEGYIESDCNIDITNDCLNKIKEDKKEDLLKHILKKYLNEENIDLNKIKVFCSAVDSKSSRKFARIHYDKKILKACKKEYVNIKAEVNPLDYFIDMHQNKTNKQNKKNEEFNKTFQEELNKKDLEFIKDQINKYLEKSGEKSKEEFNLKNIKAEIINRKRSGHNTYYTIAFYYNNKVISQLTSNSLKELINTFTDKDFSSPSEKEAKAREILRRETEELVKKYGNNYEHINDAEKLKEAEEKLKKAVVITTMPTGVSYKDNGKTINVYNGKSEKKSMLASNGVDSYITIPGNIRIGIESKAHDSDQYDPITPILYLIFNSNNNTIAGDYAIGLIDGKVINQLKKNNLDYSISGKTVFIGDEEFEKKEYRMALKNSFKDRKDWIQTDGSGKTKYILNNISIPKLGLNTIHPILGHDEYIKTIIEPLSKKYDIISVEISGAKENISRSEHWKKPDDINIEPSIVSDAYNKTKEIGKKIKKNVAATGAAIAMATSKVDPYHKSSQNYQNNTKVEINQNQQIIDRLINTVEGLKKTCEIINKNFNTTIGVEYINKFNVILQRLQNVSVKTASVKTKYFNY